MLPRTTPTSVAMIVATLVAFRATTLAAQQPDGDLAARADAAWDAGDRGRAETLYAQLVARDSSPRALIRLALLRRSRPDEAAALLRAFVAREPEDVDGWTELARAEDRRGRPLAARRALAQAATLAPSSDDVVRRLRALDARLAPSLEPTLLGSEDSDRNRTLRAGLATSRQGGETTRLRLDGGVKRVSDLAGWSTTGEAQAGLRWQPRGTVVVDATAGATMLAAPSDTVVRYVRQAGPIGPGAGRPGSGATFVPTRELVDGGRTVIPTALLRARFRAPADGPALTISARRTALDATPLLVSSRVARSEGAAALDVPIAGPLRARAGGSVTRLDSRVDARTRHVLDAALAVRARPWLELSVQAHRLGVDSATTAGWFAPRRADGAELGASVEREWENGVALSLDAGAGAQRVERFGEPAGDWARALRLWGSLGRTLAPGRGVRLEVEAYDSLLGSVAGTNEGWRYTSVSVGGWVSFR